MTHKVSECVNMKHNLNLYRHWCSPTVKLALVDYQIVWDYQEIDKNLSLLIG